MLAVATKQETQRLENELIEHWGMPQLLLMERAALGLAALIEAEFSDRTLVSAMVGPGNNGADAIAACRLLFEKGYDVRVILVGKHLCSASKMQLSWLEKVGVQAEEWSGKTVLPPGGVILDGLFGFGLTRAPEGLFLEAIEWMNAQSASVVAVDLPSGILADNGCAPGVAVAASHTVACGVLKIGLLCDPALPFVGQLWLADIGFPAVLLEKISCRILPPPFLPPRPSNAHKGSMGTLLIVGGSRSYSGAVTMALRSAIKSGAGLVYAAVPMSIRETVAGAVPEGVVLGVEEHEGFIDPLALDSLQSILGKCRAVLVGPGLGQSPASVELVKRLWYEVPLPGVFDADALIPQLANLKRSHPAILTPHPGEAARLLGLEPSLVQSDRPGAVRSISERYAALAILKGARTLLNEGSFQRVLAETSPLLATAGSGDVLAGLLGGFLAQSFSVLDAASLAVSVHGRLGAVAEKEGKKSLFALEMLSYFERALEPTPASLGNLMRIN